MADRWHVGETEVRDDRVIIDLYSLYDTPVGSNQATLSWSSIVAGGIAPPWVDLTADDIGSLADGSRFGVVERVSLSSSLSNAAKRTRVNARHTARGPVEQGLLQDRFQFWKFSEAV